MLIYLVRNLVNEKYYIGQTGQTLSERWKQHCYQASKGSKFHFHSAIRKYGPDAFICEVICEADSHEQLLHLERLWVLALRAYDPRAGYNLTFGGEGSRATQETRLRQSRARKGRKHSAGTRLKISEARKGFKMSPESIAKRNAKRLGMKLPPATEERKRKIALARLGKPTWGKNKNGISEIRPRPALPPHGLPLRAAHA